MRTDRHKRTLGWTDEKKDGVADGHDVVYNRFSQTRKDFKNTREYKNAKEHIQN